MRLVICVNDSTTPVNVQEGEVYNVLEVLDNGATLRIHRGRLNTTAESRYFEEFFYPTDYTQRHAERCVICSKNGPAPHGSACITCSAIIGASRHVSDTLPPRTRGATMIKLIAYFDTKLKQQGNINDIVSWNVTKRLMKWVQ